MVSNVHAGATPLRARAGGREDGGAGGTGASNKRGFLRFETLCYAVALLRTSQSTRPALVEVRYIHIQ